jgi:hypothetical protein
MTTPAGGSTRTSASPEITLYDVYREVGDRWDIAPITAGYKATIREPGGTPIPRYGRTPAELLKSIRLVESGS